MKINNKGKKSIKFILSILLTAIIIIIFYILLLLGEPSEDDENIVVSKPSNAYTSTLITTILSDNISTTDIAALFESPIIINSMQTPIDGFIESRPFKNGYKYVVELSYNDSSGISYKLESIKPSTAIKDLITNEYDIKTQQNYVLNGINLIWSSSKTDIRLHGILNDTLYILRFSKSDKQSIENILKNIVFEQVN